MDGSDGVLTIREALLYVADLIEQHPERYDFTRVRVPDCRSPGWLALVLGVRKGNSITNARVLNPLGFEQNNAREFYARMNDACSFLTPVFPWEWTRSAAVCARTLRRYVDVWHPVEVTS